MTMRPARTMAADVPFTLVCCNCDAGMGVESQDQAVGAGWAEIDYAPELPMANFVGLCPDCQEAFEHWSAADRSDG